MNWFGIIIGLATCCIIGLGFVWVIRGERYLGMYWWPYIIALGAVAILGSLWVSSDWGSALLGVAGASLTLHQPYRNLPPSMLISCICCTIV